MVVPIRIVLIVAALIVVVVGSLWLAQRRLIYFPGGAPGIPPEGWTAMEVRTADDLALSGWFNAGDGAGPVVVVFHGNAGTRADRIALGSELVEAGLGVLLTDYRGYGGNPGSPSEDGLRLDARAFVEWVAAEHAQRSLVLFGESLGAAVTVAVANEYPPHAVVLRSPFTSLPDVASVHYPMIPVHAMLWDSWQVAEEIRGVTAPVTVIAGTADDIVPFEQSQAVFAAAPNPADWVAVTNANHNDASLAHGPNVITAIHRAARTREGS